MKKLLQTALMAALLALTACGYHLVGHGGGSGAIPADVTTLSIVGNADAQLLAQLRQRLHSDAYALVAAGDTVDQQHHAMLHVRISPLIFTPSTYDISGAATQYRMLFTGSLQLEQAGKTLWQSGAMQQRGDVFVTGGPTSIEASRQRLKQDLSKQWLADAVGRLRSGF
ncbi:MAG: adenosylmethionine-8-amino-7-oxononanoate aminotransferase [Mariprofundus sp.]